MAGLAFLPLEKWIARGVHWIVVSIRERVDRFQRARALASCRNWIEVEGTITAIQSDSSNPREEIVYSYSTDQGYQSGSYWHWFERERMRVVQSGDRILIRYDPKHPETSVFINVV
jgi:hypothetical protein